MKLELQSGGLRLDHGQLLKMHDDEEWNCFYDTQSESFEKAPYPSLQAIQNVFALGVKRQPRVELRIHLARSGIGSD